MSLKVRWQTRQGKSQGVAGPCHRRPGRTGTPGSGGCATRTHVVRAPVVKTLETYLVQPGQDRLTGEHRREMIAPMVPFGD